MTESFPHGHPRADALDSGRQSNGMRSDNYSPSDSGEPVEEFVAAPAHGAVGVFQAPQPVRPRSAPVDTTLDIDSPFLDLFGGGPGGPLTVGPVGEPDPR